MRDFDEIISRALEFLHTASDVIGHLSASGIRAILPAVVVPDSLASTIGLLVVLSLLLGLAEVAKKAVWIIVIVGWVLVLVRIAIIVVQHT